jgi:RNA polymerase sigma factor (sigma-70 family)
MEKLGSNLTPQTSHENFKSLEELYKSYGQQAYGLALHVLENNLLAEEAVQEVFLQYWQQPALYTEQARPFVNWLLREVHCNCLERLKSSARLPRQAKLKSLINTVPAKDFHTPAQNEPGLTVLQDQARQAMSGLSQEYRNILELAFFKGLNHQEIAQATGLSARAVRQSLTSSLFQLREVLAR